MIKRFVKEWGKGVKVKLGNFTYWRIKKLIIFFVCMFCSALCIYYFHVETVNSLFLLGGLFLYGCVIQLSFVKNHFYEAEFLREEDKIKVRTTHKTYIIRRCDIREVQLKEIRYGGRWLDIIGYRLIVKANHNYIFDSVFLEEAISDEKQKMLKLKEIF